MEKYWLSDFRKLAPVIGHFGKLLEQKRAFDLVVDINENTEGGFFVSTHMHIYSCETLREARRIAREEIKNAYKRQFNDLVYQLNGYGDDYKLEYSEVVDEWNALARQAKKYHAKPEDIKEYKDRVVYGPKWRLEP